MAHLTPRSHRDVTTWKGNLEVNPFGGLAVFPKNLEQLERYEQKSNAVSFIGPCPNCQMLIEKEFIGGDPRAFFPPDTNPIKVEYKDIKPKLEAPLERED